jgi:hypothetical protein
MANTDIADFKVDAMMFGLGPEPHEGFDGTVDPLSIHNTLSFNDGPFVNGFDFESAASSPHASEVDPLDMDYPEMLAIRYDAQHSNPMLGDGDL